MTRVAVVIPNLDSPTVDRAVDSVLRIAREAQDLSAVLHEIVVVGRDRPGRLAGRSDVRLEETGPLMPGAARNIGVERSAGDVVLFLDADCEVAPGWLRAHVRRQCAGHAVVGGAVAWDTDNYWTLADNIAMFHAFAAHVPAGERPYLPTLNLSVSRAAIDSVGGMNPGLRCGEDLDWTIRLAEAGYPPFFEPRAVVWHRPPRSTPQGLLAHHYRTGRWMPAVRRRYPDVFGRPIWLRDRRALAVFGPAMAAGATLRIMRPGGAGWRHPSTLPAILLAKAAWVAGALQPESAAEDALE